MCLRDVLELCGKGQSVGIVTDADARQVLANAKSLLTMLSDSVLSLPVEEIGAGDEFIRIFVRTKGGGLNMTADERINALIARAGSPVMVMRNTQENDEEKHNGARAAIERVADEQFHGNVVDYIVHLVDTIDRLEAALSNALIASIKKEEQK